MANERLGNRFRIRRRLGLGPRGAVYLASDEQNSDRQVSLRVLLPTASPPAHLRDYLRRELEEWQSLRHSHLVAPFELVSLDVPLPARISKDLAKLGGSVEASEYFGLVAPFLDGADLEKSVSSLEDHELVEAIVHVLRGLAFIHSRGRVHGAVKASNVILCGASGRRSARLCDPLLLPKLDAGPLGDSLAGLVSAAFAPPDRRDDLLALGQTLKALPGRFLSRTLGPLIERLTESNPAQRLTTANEVIAELNELAGTHFESEPTAAAEAVLLTGAHVGRGRELSWLNGVIETLSDGRERVQQQPSVVAISGESGSGKSRLLAETARLGAERGVAVVVARGWDMGEVSFTPLADLVCRLAARPALRSLTARFAPDLQALLPNLKASFAPREPVVAEAAESEPGPAQPGSHGAGGDAGSDQAAESDSAPDLLEQVGRPFGRGAAWEERIRSLQVLSEYLSEAARIEPLLLLVDDLHFADVSSFEALRFLARARSGGEKEFSASETADVGDQPPGVGAGDPEPTGADEVADVLDSGTELGDGSGRSMAERLLVVVTVCTDELFGLPGEAAFRNLLGSEAVNELPLGRLSDEDVELQVRSLVGGYGARAEVADQLSETLAPLAEGNPLVVEQVIHELAERTRRPLVEGASAGDDVLVPDDPIEVLQRRLKLVSPEEEWLLRALAVLGHGVQVALLGQMVERSAAETYAVLSGLASRRLVRLMRGEDDLRVELAPTRLAKVLDQAIDPLERRRLHGRMARVFEQEIGADHDRALSLHLQALAVHALRSDDSQLAVRHGLRAARRAARALSNARAVNLFGVVLERLAEPDQRATGRAESLEVSVLCERAAANLAAGCTTEARTDLERAVERARDLADRQVLVVALIELGRACLESGDRPGARRRFESGDELAREAGLEALAARARIELALVDSADGEPDQALARLKNAELALETSGDSLALARALREGARVLFDCGRMDKALERAVQARNIYELAGDASGQAQALRDLAQIHFCNGDYELASEEVRQAISLHRDTYNVAGVAGGLNQIGHLMHARGEVRESLDTYSAALAVWRRIEDRPGIAAVRNNLGTVYESLGDFARAASHYEGAVNLFRDLGYGVAVARGLLNLAFCHLCRGELARARDLIDRASQEASTAGSQRLELDGVRLRAELCLMAGDLAGAESHAQGVADSSQAHGIGTTEVLARLVLGHVHIRQGRGEDAQRAFQRALEVAVDQGERSLIATVRLGLFRLHLLRGEGARAVAEVEEARSVSRRLPDLGVELLSLMALAELHLFLGQPERAAGFLEDALGRVEATGFVLRSPEVLLLRARAALELGEAESVSIAIEWLDRAEEAARRIDRKGMTGEIAAVRAEAEIARDNPGVALELARMGLESAELSGDRLAQARLELGLARAGLAQGKGRQALNQAAVALETSLAVGWLEGAAGARLVRVTAARLEAELASASEDLREVAGDLRGVWSELPAELRADFEARSLARAVCEEGERLMEALRVERGDSSPGVRAVAGPEAAEARSGDDASPGAKVAVGVLASSSPASGRRQPAVKPVSDDSEVPLESLRDSLTDLYNHGYFTTQLERELKRALRHRRPLSLLKVNVDRFKLVRDVHGQRIARRVLRSVAAVLQRNLRDIDLLARYFGDEFEALLVDTDARGAVLLADRLRAAVESETIHHDAERIEVTISVGVATVPEDGRDRDALLCRADEALYHARSRGSNQTCSFQQHAASGAGADGAGGPGATALRKVGEDGAEVAREGALDGAGGEDVRPSSPAVGDLPESSADLGPAVSSKVARLETGRDREIESLLLRREGRLVLGIVNRIVNTELDLDRMIELITGTIVDATKGERAFFLLLSRDGSMGFKYGRNIADEEIHAEQFQISRSIAQQVARHGEAVLVEEATEDARFREFKSVAEMQLRSIMCVPITVDDRVIGILYVDHNSISRRFTRDDLDFVVAVANRIAIPLNNSKLFHEQKEELRETRERLAQMRDFGTKYRYEKLIGQTGAMRKVLQLLDRVVDTHYSVVIHGESGTGKELVARAIHFNGPRQEGPFIAENCAALSETLLEAELFGHMKGAFTGADRDSKGLFELAHTGTLFLDEIGDMSERMQKKLLRVLQEGEIRPVGAKRVVPVDVRIISASNKDLSKLMEEGRFRQDLYYRLNVITVSLPPLRDRREDIALLVEHFLHKLVGDGVPLEMDQETLKVMMAYDWPGNVRELENEVNRLVAMSDGQVLPEHLSSKLTEEARPPAEADDGIGRFLGRPLKEIEEEVMREVIMRTLKKTNWHRTKAAQMLKIPTSTLFNKMKKYGIG